MNTTSEWCSSSAGVIKRPCGDVEVADFGKIRSGAEHLDVFHDHIAAFHLDIVVLFRSDSGGELHIVA